MANTGTGGRDKEPGQTIKSLCVFASAIYQASLSLTNFFHMLLSIIQVLLENEKGKKKKPSVVIETIAIWATFVRTDRKTAAAWPVSKHPGWETLASLKESPWISPTPADWCLQVGCHILAWNWRLIKIQPWMCEHFKKDTFLNPKLPCVRSNKAIVTLRTGVTLWCSPRILMGSVLIRERCNHL